MLSEKKLLTLIEEKGLDFKLYAHEPLFTVEESIKYRGTIDGAHSKNIFLKNKKNQFFLFSCIEDTHINLKKISKSLALGNISFANEDYLMNILGIKPGSVSPFGLLNDEEKKVKFFFDQEFMEYEIVNFHPLINTSTVSIAPNDLINLIEQRHSKVEFINMRDFQK